MATTDVSPDSTNPDASNDDPSQPNRINEDLFNYAIDRDEVKYLLAQLPKETSVKAVRVEYELQILKIISVGWCLSYYLQENPSKDNLLNDFWQAIRQFAESLSETTGLMIGQDIDYFNVLKERLDHYIGVMADHPQAEEPIQVIGPEFAHLCGNREDLFALMAGSKLFNNALIRVKQYLAAVKLL